MIAAGVDLLQQHAALSHRARLDAHRLLRERRQLLPAGGLGFADSDVGELWGRALRLQSWIAITSSAVPLALLRHLRQQLAGADLGAHPEFGCVELCSHMAARGRVRYPSAP